MFVIILEKNWLNILTWKKNVLELLKDHISLQMYEVKETGKNASGKEEKIDTNVIRYF